MLLFGTKNFGGMGSDLGGAKGFKKALNNDADEAKKADEEWTDKEDQVAKKEQAAKKEQVSDK